MGIPIGQILTPFHQQRHAVGMTWNNNDLNHVADQRFSLKQWFAAVAHSGTLKKTGSAHCYLRIFKLKVATFHFHNTQFQITLLVTLFTLLNLDKSRLSDKIFNRCFTRQ